MIERLIVRPLRESRYLLLMSIVNGFTMDEAGYEAETEAGVILPRDEGAESVEGLSRRASESAR